MVFVTKLLEQVVFKSKRSFPLELKPICSSIFWDRGKNHLGGAELLRYISGPIGRYRS